MTRTRRGLVVVAAAAAVVAGCSFELDRKVDYKSAGKLPPLEVPPDLTRPGRDDRYAVPEVNPSGSATYSQYSAERQGARSPTASEVLPSSDSVRLAREGNTRYLVVRETPEKIWPLLRDFWQENGFLLKVERPEAGVMETDWAENRAKIPQDPIRNVLGKYLDQIYSSGERDKFRTRVERLPDDRGSEIYISHRGMVEQIVNSRQGTGFDGTVWQPAPPNAELEAEFLKRLMVKLGADEAKAKAQVAARTARDERAKLVAASDGATTLNVAEPFDRAWRRVGLALDRVGFTVEDRDRSKGVYFVRYVDPATDNKKDDGWLAKLAFWRSDAPAKAIQYQVIVKGAEDDTQVHVLGKDGQPDTTGASKKILSLLYDQLK
ncbi:MAG: outer membrane protein assembly factor BamC [Burkholderiales bacterium]